MTGPLTDDYDRNSNEPTKDDVKREEERTQQISEWLDVFASDIDMTREAFMENMANKSDAWIMTMNTCANVGNRHTAGIMIVDAIREYRQQCAEAKVDGHD